VNTTSYLTQRAFSSLLALIGASIIIFVVIRVLPGNVAIMILGPNQVHDPAVVAAVEAELGLDRPIHVQYFEWLTDLATLDLGVSPVMQARVIPEILRRLPITLELAFLASLVSAFLGITLGTLAASIRGAFDAVVGGLIVLSMAVPSFFVALLLILFGTRYMPFIPTFDYVSLVDDPVRNLLLMIYPTIALSSEGFAAVAQNTRSEVLNVKKRLYVSVARGKGLSESHILWKHVLKNALIPVVTIMNVQFVYFMGGTIIIETLVGLPGMGRLIWDSVNLRDYVMLQNAVLVVAAMIVVVNFLTDLVYTLLNPRVQYQ
jgi:peptide/nickel transport system permease protein